MVTSIRRPNAGHRRLKSAIAYRSRLAYSPGLGVCVKIEGRRVEMLLFMLGAQRQVELRRGAIEVV